MRGERKGIRSVWIQGNLRHRAWLPGVCRQWGQASIWLGSRAWQQRSAIMTCKDFKALLWCECFLDVDPTMGPTMGL